MEPKSSLTGPELALTAALAGCWSDFLDLEALHPNDVDEFRFHIHALQNLVMARAAQRDFPLIFPRRAWGLNRKMHFPT